MAQSQATSLCLLSLIASAVVFLQGCGGGDNGGSTTATTMVMTTSTTTVMTTSTTHVQTVPLSSKELADVLNKQYMGFDESDDSSSLGVTMFGGVDDKIYCNVPCYEGRSDCRVSTSVYNHKVQITEEHKVRMTMDRHTGIIYNQAAVETLLAKCAFMFDGASDSRVNGGCGCGAAGPAGEGACDDDKCAYYNKDSRTGKNATGTSAGVTKCHCGPDMDMGPNPTLPTQSQCFRKGPAFYLPDGKSKSELRDMLKARIADGSIYPTTKGPKEESWWNEVVIDANVLLDALKADPASAIVGHFYRKGDASLKAIAQKFSDNLKANYNMPKAVPIVTIDEEMDVSAPGAVGPFGADGAEEETTLV